MQNDKRKMLQELQSNECWPILEEFLAEYIKGLNLSESIKRATEFETIWNRAYNEGGRDYLINFFKEAEAEARRYI